LNYLSSTVALLQAMRIVTHLAVLSNIDGRPFRGHIGGMKKFTAILHQGELDEGGYWATCLEVPGANGQGETREDCIINLGAAVRDLTPGKENE
jgi:predicted RNase H-like HicB family nuclease